MAELLGAFETTILLALLRLRDNAYGVSIRAEVAERTEREPSLGAIYTTLDRLEKKGLVSSRVSAPTAVRGGRRKRLCRLTPAGERALAATWDAQQRMARGLEQELARLQKEGSDA